VTLSAVVERYAQFEKRGVRFYRGLAARFAADAAAARLWVEMADAEASHFALLELSLDWIAMAGGAAGSGPAVGPEELERVDARMREIEAAAERPDATLADAVDLALRWEELELPRVLDLLPHLPDRARGRVLAAMVGEAAGHYRGLGELARAAGGPGHGARLAALAGRARAALG
jgi:rubrerythrin